MPFAFPNPLRGFFPKTEVKALTLDDWPIGFFGGATLAGPTINAVTAMRVPAVSSAVELISQLVGTLPAKLYVRAADGSGTPDPTNPLYRLVHDEANDWTSATQLRTQLTADALLNDNGGFALANRVDGRVVEFIRLPPFTVVVKADEFTSEPYYVVGGVRYAFTDILHIQSFNYAGVGQALLPFNGSAPITRAREAIGLALTLEQYAAQLFGNGARPSGTLNFPNALSPVGLKAALAMWLETHTGAGNSGKPAILDNGATWSSNSLTSVDAQFLEMRRFQTEEIARAFRVPPTMLFELERGTWSNTEEMQRQFLTYTMRPWLDAWTWAYARVLLTPEERQAGQYVEFITDDLLSADFATRMQGYALAIASRILNPNEARAAENRPPYAGGEKFENPNTTAPANTNLPSVKDDAA